MHACIHTNKEIEMAIREVLSLLLLLSMLTFFRLSRAQFCKLNRNLSSFNFTAMDNRFLPQIKSCIPPLNGDKYKGQAGRIGVIGGSFEYTGAPYFSGISALKVGADLVHIFCITAAAPVIKSYSPELIVHPLLDHPNGVEEITPWLDRLHALVIGPGLGRDEKIFKVVTQLINISKEKRIPLVIDADGLFLITQNPNLIKDYPSPGVILTPNKIEFERLQNKLSGGSSEFDILKLGANVTVLRKGKEDEFYSKDSQWQWKSGEGGSGRRCGGQGDLLSGAIATFYQWLLANRNNLKVSTDEEKITASASLACYAGTRLIRVCNQEGFQCHGRSMVCSDMIGHIHGVFETLFESSK